VRLGEREPELHAVADRLLEGEPDTLGEPVPVKVFRGVLDCVELVDALLELDTVEVCDEFCVTVLWLVCVGITVRVDVPLTETEPELE